MVDASIVGILERLGFADILLWLLTFAIVYGVLSQVNIPKAKAVRAIIGIVAAFFAIMAAPTSLLSIISNMSVALLAVLLGILVVLVFLEVGGIKHYEERWAKDEKGNPKYLGHEEITMFSKNKYIVAAALIIIAILVFMGAGGLKLLGINFISFDLAGVVFMVAIIIAVLWMIKG